MHKVQLGSSPTRLWQMRHSLQLALNTCRARGPSQGRGGRQSRWESVDKLLRGKLGQVLEVRVAEALMMQNGRVGDGVVRTRTRSRRD
ncbi:MAG: hypothetical protein EBU08_10875 [Micrococcales bacterium]|nr:hypothetical protein [Micrococcales bacterium]